MTAIFSVTFPQYLIKAKIGAKYLQKSGWLFVAAMSMAGSPSFGKTLFRAH